MLKRVQTPIRVCLIHLHTHVHCKEGKKNCLLSPWTLCLRGKGRRCGTHYAPVMISGNVVIADMPREMPIAESMKISNHRSLQVPKNIEVLKNVQNSNYLVIIGRCWGNVTFTWKWEGKVLGQVTRS